MYGDVDKIDLLLRFLNSLVENLKFIVEISGKSLWILDLKVSIDNKKLSTSVYSKPIDSQFYLDGTSFHPAKCIDAIATGVAKRLKRICSNGNDFLRQSKKWSANLAARYHQPKKITRAFEKVDNQRRSTV